MVIGFDNEQANWFKDGPPLNKGVCKKKQDKTTFAKLKTVFP